MGARVREKRQPTLEEILQALRAHRHVLAERYGVRRLGVFGSYARGGATPRSDLDLLVEFSTPPGLLGFVELERYLSRLLGVLVELVTPKALKPHIGKRVLQELVEV
jgi:predicted nucleotidyltransferase